MTLPASLWMHVHVSEREVAHTHPDSGAKDDSHWEDCLWCSVTEWLNDTNADVPDTLAFAEHLRDASGEPPTGGSNFANVASAFRKLGIHVAVAPLKVGSFLAALVPGHAGVATGVMGSFPKGHHLRRWDAAFAGGHAVYVARLSDGSYWWCDPLAPKGTYQGEKVSAQDIKTFMGSWTGIVGKLRTKPAPPVPTPQPPKETDVYPITSYLPGQTAVIGQAKVSTNVRADPSVKNPPLRTIAAGKTETWTVIGYVAGTTATGKTDFLVRWANGRYEYVAKVGVKAVADTKAALQAQVTKLQSDVAARDTRIAGIKHKTAVNAADIADD